MIRKLRAKLVLIEMFIFMLMLTVILGMVYFFTRTNLENDSMRMMRSVPNMNEEALRPESAPEGRKQFFVVHGFTLLHVKLHCTLQCFCHTLFPARLILPTAFCKCL